MRGSDLGLRTPKMEEFLLATLPHGAGTNGAREPALGESRKRGSCEFRRLWSSAPYVARPALLKTLLMELPAPGTVSHR